MGVKEKIHSLKCIHDFPILVTEELHQVFSVQGYKRKNLAALLNAFGRMLYFVEITFPYNHEDAWKLNTAGRLQSHVQLQLTIQPRLLPLKEQCIENAKHLSTETAVNDGKTFFRSKAAKLEEQQPNDAKAIFEFLGRLNHHYPQSRTWEWYLCPRAGTSLNFHIQPTGLINPKHFLAAQKECTIARISNIFVYPYTIEIIFHAFSQIEHLPYNRRNRPRFTPY